MATETMIAEKIRRKPFVQLLGTCQDCGQPVKAGQEFLRTDHGIQHALCFYEPDYAKRARQQKPKTNG
jgi:hypothetical protein